MLSLVLSSATHAFELMLSAFILGLALGAFWVRRRADRLPDPLRTLGHGAVAHGFLRPGHAAALPPGVLLDWQRCCRRSPEPPPGYAGFNLARYGLCLAGDASRRPSAPASTLPLLTSTLVLGGVVSALSAGSTAEHARLDRRGRARRPGLMPLIGLKGLLTVGALLDMALGVALSSRCRPASPTARRLCRSRRPRRGSMVALVLDARSRRSTRADALGSLPLRRRPRPRQQGDPLSTRDGSTATVRVRIKATAAAVSSPPTASRMAPFRRTGPTRVAAAPRSCRSAPTPPRGRCRP